ncbi:unnamed protein product [Moneuplotes crassus]|uniref:Uncharacterized protein n=1 Tax=Euplotes crassus TaxID=5936 RepID=A0AAD1U8X2_EUPCR|nr:unnamed protein product [Moneuplotes crassus]
MMKCNRQKNSSAKKSSKRKRSNYPTNREPLMTRFNSEVPFECTSKSKASEYRSRTLGFNANLTNDTRTKAKAEKKPKKFSNKTFHKMPDCKIFFPSKGLVGEIESRFKEKPKFVIIPKEKYIRMSQRNHFDNQTLKYSSTGRQSRKIIVNDYQSDKFQRSSLSPVRDPQRKIIRNKKHRNSNDHRRQKIAANTTSLIQNSIKVQRSNRPRTRDVKKRYALEPLVAYKAAKIPLKKREKPHIKLNGFNDNPTECSFDAKSIGNASMKYIAHIENNTNCGSSYNICSGYGNVDDFNKTLIQNKHYWHDRKAKMI